VHLLECARTLLRRGRTLLADLPRRLGEDGYGMQLVQPRLDDLDAATLLEPVVLDDLLDRRDLQTRACDDVRDRYLVGAGRRSHVAEL
jgi:hypothetical protein